MPAFAGSGLHITHFDPFFDFLYLLSQITIIPGNCYPVRTLYPKNKDFKQVADTLTRG